MTCRVVLDWDGRRWDVEGEMVRLVDEADVFALDPVIPTRRVEVALPLGDVRAWARAHHPRLATARVWHRGRLVADEAVESIVPGLDGEASTVTIGRTPDPRSSLIPASYDISRRLINQRATQRQNQREEQRIREAVAWAYYANQTSPVELTIDATFQTIYADRVEGRAYPRVYGRPGRDGTQATEGLPIDVSADVMMVAGHHVTPGTVTVFGPRNGNPDKVVSEVLSVYNTTDQAGRPIACVDVSGASNLGTTWSGNHGYEEKPWMLAWDGSARGLPSAAGDVLLDVLMHVLDVPIDWPAWQAVEGWLSGFTLDGVIDTQVDAQAVLMQQLLPMLPVRLVRGVNGVGPVPIRWTEPVVRGVMVVGVDVERSQRARYASADGFRVVNDWTVRYAANRRSKGFARTERLDAGRAELAAASLYVHGLSAEVWETAWVYDVATAGRIARHLMETTARDRVRLEVLAPADVWGIGSTRELRIGDVWTVTDAAEGITAEPAMVTRVERAGAEVDVVELVVL